MQSGRSRAGWLQWWHVSGGADVPQSSERDLWHSPGQLVPISHLREAERGDIFSPLPPPHHPTAVVRVTVLSELIDVALGDLNSLM